MEQSPCGKLFKTCSQRMPTAENQKCQFCSVRGPPVWPREGPAGSLSLGFGTVRLSCNESLFSYFISLLFFHPVRSSFARIPLPPNSYVPERLGCFLPFLDVPLEAEK